MLKIDQDTQQMHRRMYAANNDGGNSTVVETSIHRRHVIVQCPVHWPLVYSGRELLPCIVWHVCVTCFAASSTVFGWTGCPVTVLWPEIRCNAALFRVRAYTTHQSPGSRCLCPVFFYSLFMLCAPYV